MNTAEYPPAVRLLQRAQTLVRADFSADCGYSDSTADSSWESSAHRLVERLVAACGESGRQILVIILDAGAGHFGVSVIADPGMQLPGTLLQRREATEAASGPAVAGC